MSNQDIEISQQGLKLPYDRFLSDSAGGYTLALLALLAVVINAPVPGSSKPLQELVPLSTISQAGIAVLLGLLVFLLGTPVGLMLNAASWFVLGLPQTRFADKWVASPPLVSWLTKSTSEAYNFETIKVAFQVEKRGLYNQASCFEEVLRLYHPLVWVHLSHVQGIKQFVWNLAFVSLFLIPFYFLPIHYYGWAFWALVVFLWLIVLASLLEFYMCCAVLFQCYMLCRRHLSATDLAKGPEIEDVVDVLIAESKGAS